MSDPSSERLANEVLRAYAVFGIDPLDGADEFGFRFPKLSVSFLREKAERQLRDAFGRWRKMRGKIDGVDSSPGSGRPIERASLTMAPDVEAFWESKAFWESEGIDHNEVQKLLRMQELIDQPTASMRPEEVESLRKRLQEAVDSLPPLSGGGGGTSPKPYIPLSEDSPWSFLKYAKDYYLVKGKAKLRKIEAEREGREDEYMTREEEEIERYETRERGTTPFMAPLIEGSLGERLRVYHQAHSLMKQEREYLKSNYEYRQWSRRNLGYASEDLRTRFLESGYSDRPTLVPPETFDTTPGFTIPRWSQSEQYPETNGTVLFRGKKGNSVQRDGGGYFTAADIFASEQQSAAEDYYIGSGIYGSGLYFGTSQIAADYTGARTLAERREMLEQIMSGSDPVGRRGGIYRAKLRADSTVITSQLQLSELQSKVIEQIKSLGLPENQEKELLSNTGIVDGIIKDISKFAIANKVDAIVNLIGNITVFNRSALIMPDLGLPYAPPDKPNVTPPPVAPPGAPFRFPRRK